MQNISNIDYELFNKTKTSYKVYAEILEEEAQKQFADVLSLPYVTYGALMPDAHTGYFMPIGAVCSTKDVVVPQFVGFDIGCGMCAYKTDYFKDDILKYAQKIYNEIHRRIPLGFNKHKENQELNLPLNLTSMAQDKLFKFGLKQLGTLGGGNPFLEIGYGKDNRAWIIIHSGSRGFGHSIASYYMIKGYLLKNPPKKRLKSSLENFIEKGKVFKEKNPTLYKERLKEFVKKEKEAILKSQKVDNFKSVYGLNVNSKLGEDYIKDQNFALNFALENRKKMILEINQVLNKNLKGDYDFKFEDESRFINKNHNHVEYYKGEWIHRKGATHASKGVFGVIPANMRDGSFIVKGKGSKESLESSSHGAGRVMSRVKSRKNISMEEFKQSMEGIVGTVAQGTLDEAPLAYKNIFEVMELQKELVETIDHIKVLINVKDKNYKSRK